MSSRAILKRLEAAVALLDQYFGSESKNEDLLCGAYAKVLLARGDARLVVREEEAEAAQLAKYEEARKSWKGPLEELRREAEDRSRRRLPRTEEDSESTSR